jgi:hypothetical protein
MSPPSNPDPRRGPKAGTFVLSAAEAVYNIRVSDPSFRSDTVGSDDTDISERMVQAAERYFENTERNRQRDVSRERVERENKDDAQDSGTPMFRYGRYEYGVDAGQKTIGHVEEGFKEEEEETEEEGGTEESKRRAELRRREVSRRRQKRKCEAHGCHLEVCGTDHEARANVDRFMEGLEERTKRVEPMVVETDEKAASRASTGEATEWPLVFDYPRSSDSLLELYFQDLELEDDMNYGPHFTSVQPEEVCRWIKA